MEQGTPPRPSGWSRFLRMLGRRPAAPARGKAARQRKRSAQLSLEQLELRAYPGEVISPLHAFVSLAFADALPAPFAVAGEGRRPRVVEPELPARAPAPPLASAEQAGGRAAARAPERGTGGNAAAPPLGADLLASGLGADPFADPLGKPREPAARPLAGGPGARPPAEPGGGAGGGAAAHPPTLGGGGGGGGAADAPHRPDFGAPPAKAPGQAAGRPAAPPAGQAAPAAGAAGQGEESFRGQFGAQSLLLGGGPAFAFTQGGYAVYEGTSLIENLGLGSSTYYTEAHITVERFDTEGTATVWYATEAGTATPDNIALLGELEEADYVETSGALEFANGQALRTVTVQVIRDARFEPDEDLYVHLYDEDPGETLGSPSPLDSATLTVLDDDGYGHTRPFRFVSYDYSFNEGVGEAVITVERTAAAAGATAVYYRTDDGTATHENTLLGGGGGADYEPAEGYLYYGPGQTLATFGVTVNDDEADEEGDEHLYLTLGDQLATLGGFGLPQSLDSATLTILDGGEVEELGTPIVPFRFVSSDYSFTEGVGTALVVVERFGSAEGSAIVHYETSDGTATSEGGPPELGLGQEGGVADYAPASGTLNFAPGQTLSSFTVTVFLDDLGEGAQYLNLHLYEVVEELGTPYPDAEATLTILDGDEFPFRFTQMSYSVTEGNTSLVVTVERTGAGLGSTSVRYQTRDVVGSATGDEDIPPLLGLSEFDYVSTSGTLDLGGVVELGAGQSVATFAVEIREDTLVEGDEHFLLELHRVYEDPQLPGYAHATATVYIRDDDFVSAGGAGDPQQTAPAVGPVQVDAGQGNAAVGDDPDGDSDGDHGASCDCGCFCGDEEAGADDEMGDTESFTNAPEMKYLSGTVDALPAVGVSFQSLLDEVPDQIVGTLTWDGGAQDPLTYDVVGRTEGGNYALSFPVDGPVGTTDYYAWSLQVTAYYAKNDPQVVNYSGHTAVVAADASAFGAGWSVAGVDRLVEVDGGVLYVYGAGGARFFEDAGGGAFTSPANDFGTLALSGGVYTYTARNQAQRRFDGSGRQTRLLDPSGQAVTFSYDGGGRLERIQSPGGQLVSYSYNTGKLSRIESPAGVTTVTVDGGGDLTVLHKPGGALRTFSYDGHKMTADRQGPQTTSYAYDGYGRVATVTLAPGQAVAVAPAATRGLGNMEAPLVEEATGAFTDAAGRATAYALDGQGRALAREDADGAVTLYQRDNLGRLQGRTDPLGRSVRYEYGAGGGGDPAAGDLTKVTYEDGTSEEFQYDATYHQVTVHKDRLGRLTTYSYDAGTGELLTVTDPLGAVTSYTWSGGLMQTATDPLGHTTTYFYNGERRLLATVLPDGTRTTLGYDAAGRPLTSQDALSRVVTTLYDAQGRLTQTSYPNGSTVTSVYDAQGRVTSTTDQRGVRTDYVYDARGDLRTQTLGAGTGLAQTTTYLRDAAGNLTGTVTPSTGLTQYLLDAGGRATVTIDALSRRTTQLLDAAGTVTGVVDARGQLTQYLYDSLGRQTVTADPAGGRTTSLFDAGGLLTGALDARGNLTRYLYDALGRQTVTVMADGAQAASLFDAAGNLTGSLDARGNLTAYLYDGLNRQTVTVDALGHRMTSLLDAVGNVTGARDGLGNLTAYLYDSLNRATVTVDPLGNRATTLYDSGGSVTGALDPRGGLTRYLYDSLGRQTVTVDALDRRTTSLFDAAGRLTGALDARGNLTQYVNDALGRASVTVDAQSHRTTTLFDAGGNVTGIVDGLTHLRQFVYDAAGRQTVTVDALGSRHTALLDAAGNVTGAVNPRGSLTQYVYDGLNRATVTVDALTRRTTSLLDANGNVTGVLDARGNLTQYVYDALNRATVTVNGAGDRTTQLFDAAGRLTGVKDGRGNLTQYVVDAAGRTTVTIDADSKRTTVGYDAAGNTVSVKDPNNNVTTYLYDALNRQTVTIDARLYRTTQLFDAAGNLTALIDAQDGFNNVTTFAYDSLNRRTAETDPLGQTATFAYNAVGLLTSTTDRNGRRRDFQYDAADRLSTETWVQDSSTVETLTTLYDAAGNVTVARSSAGAYTLSYDALDRVTVARGLWGVTLTMTYDEVGNRVRVQDSLGGVTTSVYDAANRLTTRELNDGNMKPELRVDLTYNAVSQIETLRRYSDLGGTESVGSTTYSYDALNRVRNIQHRGPVGTMLTNTTYSYDAGGRLLAEVLNGTPTSYSYDATDQLEGDSVSTYAYDGTGNRDANYGGPGNRLLDDGTWAYFYDAEGNLTEKRPSAPVGFHFVSADYRFSEGVGTAVVTVERSGSLIGEVSVWYQTADGTAGSTPPPLTLGSAGYDYDAASGALVFAHGQTLATFAVTLIDDEEEEGEEYLGLGLWADEGSASLFKPLDEAALSILDNDDEPELLTELPAFRFVSADYRFHEGVRVAAVTVERTGSLSGSATVDYETSDGTATGGPDYQAAAGTLTFGNGQSLATFTVAVRDDAAAEGDESLDLALYGGEVLLLGVSPLDSATLTILEDDAGPAAVPEFRFVSVAYRFSEGVGEAVVTVERTGSSAGSAAVEYATSDGTASGGVGTGSYDYEPASGTVSFADGQRLGTFSVVITEDLDEESDEYLNLALYPHVELLGVSPLDEATLTILDNDGKGLPPFRFVSVDYRFMEGVGEAVVTVERTGSLSGSAYVDYTTGDGTALNGYDYASASGTLSFGSGQSLATFAVVISDDGDREGDKALGLFLYEHPEPLALGEPGPSVLLDSATLTITDDDPGQHWGYGYNHRNQMTWAELRDGAGGPVELRADYGYDYYGNRVEKEVDWDGEGEGAAEVTRFALDGWRPGSGFVGLENWDAWAVLDGSNDLDTRYLRGDAIDQVFAQLGAGASWLLTDRLGSVRAVVDADGVLRNTVSYDGWGNATQSDPEWGSRYLWTGREVDVETGLQFNRARYYDPRTGRWTSTDPIGFDAGDSNLYRYVMNKPTETTDPSGFEEITIPSYWIAGRSSTPMSEILKGIPILGKNILPNMPAPLSSAAGTAVGIKKVLGVGEFLGVSGAGPCVGVVLTTGKAGDPTYALHFQPGANVNRGFEMLGVYVTKQIYVKIEREFSGGYYCFPTEVNRIPSQYKAFICGAEENENWRLSKRTLENLINILNSSGVKIEGYIPGPSVHVDRDGKAYWTTPASLPTEKYYTGN